MSDTFDKIQSILVASSLRPTIPLPDDSSSLVRAIDGWQIHAINGLWADEPNRGGDLTLVTPTGRVLGAIWDVSSNGTPSTEFFDDPHLQLNMHFTTSIGSWEQLVAEVLHQIPAISLRYSEVAPSDGSLERSR